MQAAEGPDGLDVALIGVLMDLGVTNRGGAGFGPRTVRTIERIGPCNHALKVAPSAEYLWEFSFEFGMTVVHAETFAKTRAVLAG